MWRLCWMTWAAIVFSGLSGAYQESEPVYYVALQGDLSVPVTQENITRARISNAANGQSIAEWTSKDTGNDGGNITFPCGVVNRAGTYVLQLQYNGDQWIDHQELRVSWPPVLVQAPSELVNYRTAFNVKIQWIHLKCYPPVDANLTVLAQVVHCGLRDGNSSFSANCTAPLLRSTQLVPNFWQTGGVGTDVRFDCQTLDHPGYYRVYLREEQDDDHLIGTSDSIHVDLNEEFQLQVRAKFALPCHRELPVFYHRPACVTGAQDRVRVYGKTFASNFSSSDYTLNYIGEKILDPNRSVVALPCAMLDGWNFDLLCFTYVTLASSDGAVIDIIQTCIPNQNTSMFQKPEWGSWSAFSECTSRNCGYRGVRYRYRYCEQPSPRYAGSFCTGEPIETVNCQAPFCSQKGEPTQSPEVEHNSQIKENLTSECKCGCTMELADGTFSLVVSSALCQQGYLTWTFTAPSYSHFHLGLDYLRLDCQEDDRLTIRDGLSIFSPMVALLNSESASPPEVGLLTTSSSQLLIEFNVTRKSYKTLPKCVAGFVATITSVPKEEVVGVERRFKLEELPPPVLTLSSLMFMLLCAVSILAIMYSKCGMSFKHGKKIRKSAGHRSHDITSLWSEASDYQLVSTGTTLSSIDTLNTTADEINEKNRWLLPTRLANLMRMQKSLPNSPFLSTARSREARRLNRLSRSSTSMSPMGYRRYGLLDTMRKYSPNSQRRPSPEGIEMSLITRTESDATLKEEKILNTVSSRVLLASQSLADDTNSVSRSTFTQSCSAVFDPDQDLEFDYYDLDVRNAGCDAPDSFLRCLADDSVYWDEADIDKSLRDPEDLESIDGSMIAGELLEDDDVSCA